MLQPIPDQAFEGFSLEGLRVVQGGRLLHVLLDQRVCSIVVESPEHLLFQRTTKQHLSHLVRRLQYIFLKDLDSPYLEKLILDFEVRF